MPADYITLELDSRYEGILMEASHTHHPPAPLCGPETWHWDLLFRSASHACKMDLQVPDRERPCSESGSWDTNLRFGLNETLGRTELGSEFTGLEKKNKNTGHFK